MSCFFLLCPAVLQFLEPQDHEEIRIIIILISSWSWQQKQPGLAQFSLRQLGVVEDSCKPCWRAFWQSAPMMKYSKFEINVQSVRFLTKILMRFLLVKDKFPNISNITSKMGSRTTRLCVFCTFSTLTFDWRIEQCWNLAMRYKTGKWGK